MVITQPKQPYVVWSLPFEYRTTIVSGIQVSGIQMVTVHSQEKSKSNILFPNVKYKDLCATINVTSFSSSHTILTVKLNSETDLKNI